mmetsp:Transcript_69037/g.173974  ORF Transcript_69037/g.173974 Transcript_69037/m.173974 type:complete len:224 (-) Transcript_69037:1473-2144(-)
MLLRVVLAIHVASAEVVLDFLLSRCRRRLHFGHDCCGSLVHHEFDRRLLVHDAQRIELLEDLVPLLRIHLLLELFDDLLGSADDAAGLLGRVLEEPVVQQGAVPHVRMRDLLDRLLQQSPQHGLHLRRPAEEQLDRSSEHLQPNCSTHLLSEAVYHRLEQVRRILDEQAVLPKDPQDRAFTFRLRNNPHASLHSPRGPLKLLGILPDEILHDNCSLRADIVNI